MFFEDKTTGDRNNKQPQSKKIKLSSNSDLYVLEEQGR